MWEREKVKCDENKITNRQGVRTVRVTAKERERENSVRLIQRLNRSISDDPPALSRGECTMRSLAAEPAHGAGSGRERERVGEKRDRRREQRSRPSRSGVWQRRRSEGRRGPDANSVEPSRLVVGVPRLTRLGPRGLLVVVERGVARGQRAGAGCSPVGAR